jgi:flavin reductase (DIM6/NTAB) family NADH-FMN oxidoreductase RutF/DNA-binding IclR family transcriptional regulator
MTSDPVAFDARELRTALGAFPTGVTVITTQDGQGRIHGLTANSFNTVSLDPPLILWSQSKKAGSYDVFRAASEFAISILAEDQFEVSSRFASRHEDKFSGVAVDRAFCGLPVIAGSSAWIHCHTVSQVDGGDHTIYIGEIKRISRTNRRPLVFGGGQYMLAQPHHALLAGAMVPSGARQRHAVRICSPYMQRIAEDLDVPICLSVWGNCGPTIVAWEVGASSELPGFPLGILLPVTTSASGQCFAAHLDASITADLVERELAQAAQACPGDTVVRQRWLATLQEVRTEGIARNPGTAFWNDQMLISGVSVPVRDSNGQAIATVSVVAAPGKDPAVVEQACTAIKAAVAKIERQLGYAESPSTSLPITTTSPTP